MALKITSIDGKQDVVVTSAEYVQATGIVGLETSGNIEKIIQGDKVILSGKGGGGGQEYTGAGIIVVDGDTISADMSDYYNVEEVNELLDEKEDKIRYSYDKNRAISAINGSAVAQTESWRVYSEQAGSMSDSHSNVYIGNGNRDRTSTNTFNIGSNNRASACTGSFNIGSENIIDTGFVVTNIGNQNTKVSSYDTSELSSFIPNNDFAKKYNGVITANIGTPGGTNIGYNNRMVNNGINIGNTNIVLRSSNMGDAINIGKYNINNYGVIIGQRNETSGYSFIIGEDSFTTPGSFAYGKASSATEGSYAFGDGVSSHQGAFAIGKERINALGQSLAMGFRGVTANGEAVAIGSEGVTAQGGGIAIGRQGVVARYSYNSSDGPGSLAIGGNGVTACNGATAIGSMGIQANNDHCIAMGAEGVTAENGASISIGSYGSLAKNHSINIGVKGQAENQSIVLRTNYMPVHDAGQAQAKNYSMIAYASDRGMTANSLTGSVIIGAGKNAYLGAEVGSVLLNSIAYDEGQCNLQSKQNSIIIATPSNNIDYDIIHRNGTASYTGCNLLVKNNSLMLGAGINGTVTVENDSYLIGGNTKGNTSGHVTNGSWVMGYNNMANGGNFILGHRNDAAGVIAETGTSAEVRPYNQAVILGNNNFVRNYKPYLYALKPIYKARKLFSAYISDDGYKATWYGDSYLGSDESIIKNLIVGDYNRVSGYNAFVFGMANTAGVESYNYNPETSSISGDKNDDGFTLAFGMHNRAVRNYDIAIGLGTTASGGENIAIGTYNGYYNTGTVAIGYKNIAHHSHIEGIENIALNSNVQIPFTAGGSTGSYAYTHNFFRNVRSISLNKGDGKFNFNDNIFNNIEQLTLNYNGNDAPWSQNTISNVRSCSIAAQSYLVNNKMDTITGVSFGAQTATRNILQYIKDSSFGAVNQFDANILYDVGGDSQAVNFTTNYMYKNIIARAGNGRYNPLTFTANVVANNIINNTKIQGSTTLGLFDNIFCHSQITLNNITSGIDISDNNLFTDAVLYGTYVDGGAVNETFSFASPEGFNDEQARLKHVTKTVNFGDNKISNASETHVMGSMNKVFDAGKTRIFGTCNEVLGNNNDYFNTYGDLTVENTIIGTVNSIANIHSTGNYNTCFNNNLILGKANTLYFRGLNSTWLTNNTIIGGNNGFYDIPSTNIQNIIDRSLYGFINYNNGEFHENILGLGSNYSVGKAHNLLIKYSNSASYNNARNTILGYHSVIGSNIDDTTLIGSYNNAYYDKKFAYDAMTAKYPEYDLNHSYTYSDCVIYNGIPYSSKTWDNNKGYIPSTNPSKWVAIPFDPTKASYGVNSNNFALGAFNLLINGSNQIALGNSNITSGHDAMVLGEGLIANASQVVVGRFNETVDGTNGISAAGIDNTSGAVFVVGNGIHQNSNYDVTATKRSNAMIVSADGTVSATRFATSGVADLEAKILELENIIATFSARWVLTNQPEQNNG